MMIPEVVFNMTRDWMSVTVSAGAVLLAAAVLWCVFHLRSHIRIDQLPPLFVLSQETAVPCLGHASLSYRYQVSHVSDTW